MVMVMMGDDCRRTYSILGIIPFASICIYYMATRIPTNLRDRQVHHHNVYIHPYGTLQVYTTGFDSIFFFFSFFLSFSLFFIRILLMRCKKFATDFKIVDNRK